MIVLHTISEVRAARAKLGKLALVPTMGALHAGHVSLVEVARKFAPHVAVSIFVNPTQFGPKEDFSRYPRSLEADLEKCKAAKVDLVFNPAVEEMYPPGRVEIQMDLPPLTDVLEGIKRPGHFKGVCQVVAKLFNIFQPNVACFGRKDYQQYRIIASMVECLDWPIQILPCPIMREPGGLAMSSRNQYLSADDRRRALTIRKALLVAKEYVAEGNEQTARIVSEMQQMLLDAGLGVDYVAAVDPINLRSVREVSNPTLFAVAAWAGATRLIDNTIVSP